MNRRYHGAWNNALRSNSSEKTSRPLKFTTGSNNSMGKSVSHGPVCLSGVSASERAESTWRMNHMIVGQESAEEPFGRKSDGNILLGLAGGYPCRLSDRSQNSQCSLLLRDLLATDVKERSDPSGRQVESG